MSGKSLSIRLKVQYRSTAQRLNGTLITVISKEGDIAVWGTINEEV